MKGQSRVIIEKVQPQIDGGLYPVKRTVGEKVLVTVNIFGDGHDHIRAHLLYKKESSSAWHTVELVQSVNDEWSASFQVVETGYYAFTIKAWIDHLETWYDGFKKKAEANLEVQLELQEGIILLKKLTQNARQDLLTMVKKLEQATYTDAVTLVQSEAFRQVVHDYPLIEHETSLGKDLRIWVEHTKAAFSTWYELFPRSASTENRHGTFADVWKLLPRVKAMGFDVLYLPPIHPIGKQNRKGKNNSVKAMDGEPGSPWAIGSNEGGHTSIHQQLGTLADYKKLIAESKKHGIDIAFDLAFQCAPDHPYVQQHPEWFKQRPDGSIQYAENPPKKYQDIYPFNFECDDWRGLWEELKSVMLYWINQGVQIFRVDNPHTKPIQFWQWVMAEINKEHPDIIFLSEAFTRPKIMASLAKVGFTQSYTYFTWRNSKYEIIAYMNELVLSELRDFFRPNFWPNTPDILPFHLQYQDENIFIIRLALAATLSSNYGVYGPAYEFQENIPVEGKEEYFNSEKYEVRQYDWKRTNRITDIISIVNKARHEHTALQSTWNIEFCAIENSNLLAFLKVTDDLSDVILVVVNLDPHNVQSGYVQLPIQKLKLKIPGSVELHELITDEHYTWVQEWNYVQLDPYKMPFHLFSVTLPASPSI